MNFTLADPKPDREKKRGKGRKKGDGLSWLTWFSDVRRLLPFHEEKKLSPDAFFPWVLPAPKLLLGAMPLLPVAPRFIVYDDTDVAPSEK